MVILCSQAGARALSKELASPPIEVVLVEAAVAIIRQCRPLGSAESGLPVSQVVPTAVMSFLRRRVSPLATQPISLFIMRIPLLVNWLFYAAPHDVFPKSHTTMITMIRAVKPMPGDMCSIVLTVCAQ